MYPTVKCQHDRSSTATVFTDVFTLDELKTFNEYIDSVEKQKGTVQIKGSNTRQYRPDIKNYLFAQINDSPITDDVLDGLQQCIDYANDNYYNFEIVAPGDEYFNRGFVTHDYPVKGIFDGYHQDWNNLSKNKMWKLTCVLQLSEGYEGGDLVLFAGHEFYAPKDIGTLIIFPSFTLHGVREVTKGMRRSLCAWVYGKESLR